MRIHFVGVTVAALLVLAVGRAGRTAIDEDEVLVIYNSGDVASLAVFDHYIAVHPGIIGFDLKPDLDAMGMTLSVANIDYVDFVAKIRNPIRSFLSSNDLTHEIVAITLTKGIPHRIRDLGADPNVGDSPGDAGDLFGLGNATYASVDSELTLLWQDLESAEAGGAFDSDADNFVANPFHGERVPIKTFIRDDIDRRMRVRKIQDEDGDNYGWELREGFGGLRPTDGGDIYLVTRLDGDTVADVTASIDRAQKITFLPRVDRIVLDENTAADLDGEGPEGDYDRTAMFLAARGYTAVTHDTSSTFLVGSSGSVSDPNAQGVSGSVAVLASYGGNHNASATAQDGFISTYDGQLVDGAILNTLESYNGRPFGGLAEFADQGSLAEWLANGGTLGVGNVWEPFAFSVSDNEILLDNFLFNGLTWAEAAWSSIPALSWQQVVLGDPLAVAPEPNVLVIMGIGVAFLHGRRRNLIQSRS